MKWKIILLVLCCFVVFTGQPNSLNAQQIDVDGDGVINGGLELKTVTNSFFPPAMTTMQRDSLPKLFGSMIFNTDNNRFQGYAHGPVETIDIWDFIGFNYILDNTQSVGQSLTSDFDGFIFEIFFFLRSVNVPGDHMLKIYDGEGYAGTVLDSQIVTFNSILDGLVKLNNPIDLSDGQQFSVELSTMTSAIADLQTEGFDTYFGGGLILNGGTPSATDDLAMYIKFREVGWRNISN